MTDRDAFIRAICAEPECDTRRLAFADWLDENGEGGRAEFVRAQLLLGTTRRRCLAPVKVNQHATRACLKCRMCVARNRERELFNDHWRAWVPVELGNPVTYCRNLYYTNSHDGWTEAAHFTRGFIVSIELPCAAFLEHAAAIFRAHPVTEVRLTNMKPAEWHTVAPLPATQEADGMFFWHDGSGSLPEFPHRLPCELCPLEEGFRSPAVTKILGRSPAFFATEDEAHAALSRRAVAHGRHRAGLPPLRIAPSAPLTSAPV